MHVRMRLPRLKIWSLARFWVRIRRVHIGIERCGPRDPRFAASPVARCRMRGLRVFTVCIAPAEGARLAKIHGETSIRSNHQSASISRPLKANLATVQLAAPIGHTPQRVPRQEGKHICCSSYGRMLRPALCGSRCAARAARSVACAEAMPARTLQKRPSPGWPVRAGSGSPGSKASGRGPGDLSAIRPVVPTPARSPQPVTAHTRWYTQRQYANSAFASGRCKFGSVQSTPDGRSVRKVTPANDAIAAL